MRISTKDWLNYINKMRKLNNTAADLMQEYIRKNGFADTQAVADYAYALITKYGEGSAELAAEMYEAIADSQGASIPPAVPASTSSYGDVARAINGSLLQSPDGKKITQVVGRHVKLPGADTMLKNAIRDGAEFAWVPFGDTCAFCITLASRGWQHISKKALKKGHAEHIHANCDCQYCVRFDGKSNVDGYNPDVYRDMYYGADGNTPGERINALRRINYANKKAAMPMDLQFFAKVPDAKLINYALDPNHPTGKNKAKVFKSALGYTQNNYNDLKQKVLDSFNENELIYKGEKEGYKLYEQVMNVTGPNGNTKKVVTAWKLGKDAKEHQLTSIYVKKGE